MKMKMTAVMLAATLVLGLSACGGASKGNKAGTESSSVSPEVAELTFGEATVNIGDFCVTIPKGWLGVIEENAFEKKADGTAKVVTDAYSLVKGGKTKLDVAYKPTVYINYYADKSAQEKFASASGLFSGTSETDFTVGGKTIKGYFGETNVAQEGSEPDYFKREVAFIPASETSCFRVYIESYSPSEGEHEVDITDTDMTAIIESLKVN